MATPRLQRSPLAVWEREGRKAALDQQDLQTRGAQPEDHAVDGQRRPGELVGGAHRAPASSVSRSEAR